jgi:sigma-B regulation protein RsbU (phosphoserine phosphatase)
VEEAAPVEASGPPIGLFEGRDYECRQVRLGPGDCLVLFSDGVTEAMNLAGDEFSDERLLACVHANRGKPPQMLLDALFSDVRAFCGEATQSDDMTVVLVRYNG